MEKRNVDIMLQWQEKAAWVKLDCHSDKLFLWKLLDWDVKNDIRILGRTSFKDLHKLRSIHTSPLCLISSHEGKSQFNWTQPHIDAHAINIPFKLRWVCTDVTQNQRSGYHKRRMREGMNLHPKFQHGPASFQMPQRDWSQAELCVTC